MTLSSHRRSTCSTTVSSRIRSMTRSRQTMRSQPDLSSSRRRMTGRCSGGIQSASCWPATTKSHTPATVTCSRRSPASLQKSCSSKSRTSTFLPKTRRASWSAWSIAFSSTPTHPNPGFATRHSHRWSTFSKTVWRRVLPSMRSRQVRSCRIRRPNCTATRSRS